MNPAATSNRSDAGVCIPVTIQDALTYKKLYGNEACFIFGGTLLQTQWEAGAPVPRTLISLENIKILKEIDYIPDESILSIGAGMTLHECQNHQVIKTICAPLSEAVKQIAAPAIRNRGTIGGNVIGKTGDLIPLLLAFDASLVFETTEGERTLSLYEWLEEERGQTDLCPILKAIRIPCIQDNEVIFFRKIMRREAFAPAIVTISGYIEKATNQLRLAVGGGDNRPIRLQETEYLL
ncbi:FAD binding domain-containing protein, partial [Pradoshia sp.]